MKAIFLGMIMVSVLLPETVLAQAGGLVPCSGPDCTTAHVSTFANGLINFLISMLGVIAVIALVFAGFKMVMSQGNEAEWGKAKEMFTNVVIGIIIILAAWLIVDTLLKGLTGSGLDVWGVLGVTEPTTPGQVASGGIAAGTLSHQEARERLGSGISVVSSGNCSDRSRGNCTSLDGMRQETIDHIVELQQSCNCTVTVTGGTETGHAGGPYSHSSGYKVDLGLNAGINNYITQNMTRSGSRGSDPRYCGGGNEYVREGNHWDITVGANC